MPDCGLVSEVRAVDWRSLKSAYGSGEVVRDVVVGLASRDEAEVRQAWQEIICRPDEPARNVTGHVDDGEAAEVFLGLALPVETCQLQVL